MWKFLKSTPTCPVEDEYRDWVDGRFRWLQAQFGKDAPAKTRVILPTPEYFPDDFTGTEEDAAAMLRRVAGYMKRSPKRFELVVFENWVEPQGSAAEVRANHAAGLYFHRDPDAGPDTPVKIGIGRTQLADPMALVAVLAHEISHEILLGEKRLSRDEQDHEPLTDLTTVFFGLGIFNANATIHDRGWTTGNMSGWETRSLGYLNQRVFGYALAKFAHARGETDPPWASYVRPDVRSPMKQGLRYLAWMSKNS